MNEPQEAGRRHLSCRAGFTIVEGCIALAIAAIAAAAATPILRTTFDARRLEGVASEVASDLRFARSTAIARNERVRFTLQEPDGGTCYVIHTGNAKDCRCSGGAAAACQADARQIKTVWLPVADRVAVRGNVASLLFDPVMGTSTPSGTLRVIGANREVRHVVNLMGRVRSCAAPGAFAGYAAC
jgi:type IV fimbrial biogenesis protein FimT